MAYDEITLKKHFLNFSGGQNTREEPNRIGESQSPDLLNVRPVGVGSYAPRNGISAVGNLLDTIGSCRNIYTFVKKTVEVLVRTRSTAIEFLKTSDNTWTVIPSSGTLTDGKEFGFANDDAFLYYGNGVDDFAIWDGVDKATQTFTVDAGTDIITATAHGLVAGNLVVFSSDTTLPSGISAGTVYFVVNATTDTFKISATYGGTAIDITDTGTGTHSVISSVKKYPSLPKGNIYQIFEGKLFIAGNPDNPSTLYYSVTGNALDFSGSGSGTQLLSAGGDAITAMEIGTAETGEKALLIFKKSSRIFYIVFDADANLTLKELKRDTGSVNDKSTVIVENDIFHIDPGNNISNLGLRENIANDVRTDPQSTLIGRSTSSYDFTNACGVYSKKYKMVLYCMKESNSGFNNVCHAFFTDPDFLSWWKWKGINANQFAIYGNEVVWASSVDPNVYMYDTTKFDDNTTGEEGTDAGSIRSYYSTRDEEFADDLGTPLSDRYKQARFVKVAGFVSAGATPKVSTIYDGNVETKSEAEFSGTDTDITVENVSVYFGSTVFGHEAFGGSAESDATFPMREFYVVVSLDSYSHRRARVVFEVEGAGLPYLVTMISMWSYLKDEEYEPENIRI